MPSATTVELLWGTQQSGKRGPKPALLLETILVEAIAIADTEGLALVTMQRVSERLGVTKMSLYRYLIGKDQLTALMLDAAMLPVPDLTAAQQDSTIDPWRLALRVWAVELLDRFTLHPWTVELISGTHIVGPSEMGWMESALDAMHNTGLTGAEQLDTIAVLAAHARSVSQQIAAARGRNTQQQDPHQFTAALAASGDRYPLVAAAFAEKSFNSSGDAFSFGIDRILDGLATLIAASDAISAV